MVTNNCRHIITQEGSTLQNAANQDILVGHLEGASIIIKMHHPKRHEVHQLTSSERPSTLRKLHARLGHRHVSSYDRDCEYCLAIKSTLVPYSKIGSQEKLQGRVFVDLMGPFGKNDVKGYIATVVVDSSDETIAIVLNNKDEFFNEWIPVWNRLNSSYGCKFNHFKCDGGGEFINHRMEKWQNDNGIQFSQSNPYAHTQNSIVERRNRTLRESAMTMCLMANMNFDIYWPTAITCAAFILNLQISSRTKCVPYTAKTGKTFDLNYLRPYGHQGFMHIHKETRTKNEPRGMKVRLLGFSGNGYYLEDTMGNNHYTRDVRWLQENDDLKLRNEFVQYDSDSSEEPTDSNNSNYESVEEDNSFHTADDEAQNTEDETLSLDDRLMLEDQRSRIDQGNIVQGKRTRNKVSFSERELDTIERLNREANIVYKDMQFSEALSKDDKDEWIKGVRLEFSSLVKLKSFMEAILPKGRKAIDNRWVMHRKTDGRYRPRLVIKGFQQQYGIDFFNSHAPVAGYHVFRMVLAIAATEGLIVETYDCSTAFAQNDLKEEVYIKIPEGYNQYCEPTQDMKSGLDSHIHDKYKQNLPFFHSNVS